MYVAVKRIRDSEGGDLVEVMLDGQSLTFETKLHPLMALRLGQALIRTVAGMREIDGAVDRWPLTDPET